LRKVKDASVGPHNYEIVFLLAFTAFSGFITPLGHNKVTGSQGPALITLSAEIWEEAVVDAITHRNTAAMVIVVFIIKGL